MIDTATGSIGTVRIVERRAAGLGELYAIDLRSGAVIFRGGDELAADAPPAAV